MVDTYTEGAFPLVQAQQAAVLYVDPNDADVVRIAAEAFRKDVEQVTGILPDLRKDTGKLSSRPVIIGTVGQSDLIDRLGESGKLPLGRLRDSWETFTIAVVDHPFEQIEQALVIAGSDRRWTTYGVFGLSRMMGRRGPGGPTSYLGRRKPCTSHTAYTAWGLLRRGLENQCATGLCDRANDAPGRQVSCGRRSHLSARSRAGYPGNRRPVSRSFG